MGKNREDKTYNMNSFSITRWAAGALNTSVGPGTVDFGSGAVSIDQAIEETKDRAEKAEEIQKLTR